MFIKIKNTIKRFIEELYPKPTYYSMKPRSIYPKLVVVLLLLLFGKTGSAQYYFYDDKYYYSPITIEAGVSLDAMNCLTDLGGAKGIGQKFIKDLNIGKTHLAGGVYLNIAYNDMIALRLEETMGNVSANDNVLKGISDEAQTRYNRNLSFRSKINELSVMVEIHPLAIYHHYMDIDAQPAKISPYILGGVGFFSFNPQTQLGNRWVDLQPLSTEGEGFMEYPKLPRYKLQQINYPVGAGARYELTSTITLRAEFVYRILQTDYLDDVSGNYIDPTLYNKYFTGTKLSDALALNDREINPVTPPGGKRGNPKQNDAYFTFNLKAGFVLGRQKIR